MRRRFGFTLVEVTLVIAIGAILVSGAMWAFQSYRNSARIQAGKMNMAAIRQSIQMYRYRTGERFPWGYEGDTTTRSGSSLQNLPDAIVGQTGIPSSHSLSDKTPVCVNSHPFKLSSIPVAGTRDMAFGQSLEDTSKTFPFYGAAPTDQVGSPYQVRAGILGNVDDKCQELVRTGNSDVMPGMGLADPWLGYMSVRLSTDPSLPTYVNSQYGFWYPAAGKTWGGIRFDWNASEVHFVLPSTYSTGAEPPSQVGYFPGDPPVHWGK